MSPALSFETVKIVGTPTDHCWSQIHTFIPQEQEKKEKRGDLMAVLVITGIANEIQSITLGREVLSRLHEEYYGNVEGEAFERLGLTLEKVGGEYEGIQIICSVIIKNIAYLGIIGEGKILLKREGKIGALLESDRELQTASGFIKEGDLLLLGSTRFFSVVGEGVLKAALETDSPQEAVEILAPIILGREDMADAAAIIALFKEFEEEFLIKTISQEEQKEEISEEEAPLVSPEAKKKTKKFFFSDFMSKIKFPLLPRRIIIRGQDGPNKKKKLFFFLSLFFLSLFALSLFLGLRRKWALGRKSEIVQPFSALPVASQKQADGEASSGSLFIDLNTAENGFEGIMLAVSGKDLGVLDSKSKKIILVNLGNKSFEKIDLPFSEASLIANLDGQVYFWGQSGIWEFLKSSKKITPKVETDSSWQDIKSLAVFNGNLYLLDVGASYIWRYPAIPNGFGLKSNWFTGGNQDLSKTISFAIDGSIWLLAKDGISKFNLGKKVDFSLSNMPASQSQGGPESFSNPTRIYTSDKDKYLYILDKQRGKIYVINKNGEYKTAYIWEGLKEANDFVVIESAKKIFLLSGAKIYEIGLR